MSRSVAPSPGPRLVLCVASHGWGHLAQSVQLVRALHARIPDLSVTVRTGLSGAVVRARFADAGLPEPAVSPDETEFGFVMHDALSIDDDASLDRYRALFGEREALLARERDALRALGADIVLSNVGWLPIAAAASLGLSAYGACSLNWADLLDSRPLARADVTPIVDWMADCYARADALFALRPGMPFERFANRVPVAPVARVGTPRRAALRDELGLRDDARIVLMGFGGLPMTLDTRAWRLPDGWHAIVFAQGARGGPATTPGHAIGWPFGDLMASADVLVAKPGYGTFAEAGFLARDTLVLPRDDWAETPYLVDWLARHARVATLPLDALRAGRIGGALAAIDAQPRRAAASGDGAADIAEVVAARLGVPPVSPRGTGARTGG